MSFSISEPSTRTSTGLSWRSSRSMRVVFRSLTAGGRSLPTEREYTLVVARAAVVEAAAAQDWPGVCDETPRIPLHYGPRRRRGLARIENDFPGTRNARACPEIFRLRYRDPRQHRHSDQPACHGHRHRRGGTSFASDGAGYERTGGPARERLRPGSALLRCRRLLWKPSLRSRGTEASAARQG